MRKKTGSSLLDLPTQGVILLVALVILTSCAIGIPALWLIYEQLDQQAWELVQQGNQMVRVLLEARYNELNNLAILTAQRPTLAQLLASNDSERLAVYLETLRAGANLDTIVICDQQHHTLVRVGDSISDPFCLTAGLNKIASFSSGTGSSGWLVATQPVPDGSSYSVVVGQAFDSQFSNQLSEQTGLEHLFVMDQLLLGGSFTDNNLVWQSIRTQHPQLLDEQTKINTRDQLDLDRTKYYALHSEYETTGLEILVLLPDTILSETRLRLTQTAAFGILIVMILGSGMAILLTHLISRPLERLRDSAYGLRMGDLTTPIPAESKVREIAEVSYALEDARIALQHTLQDLSQEKAWSDYLLESVVEGVVTLDRIGRITFFSRGAERITGWKQDLVLGKSIDEVFYLADRERRFSECVPGPGGKQEIVTILVDERPLTLAVNWARLTPPEAATATQALSIRDISNEEAMRGLLGDFLGNITHEFRTPLTALAVSIELLLDQLPDLTPDELHELLVSNRLGVLRLQNLIDNLLEGASIEAGHFQVSLQPTDLAEVIQETIRTMQPLLEKKHQSLRLEIAVELPLVQADPRRINQVLVNLLSNAIKWAPGGSEILLAASIFENVVKIAIVDQGPGIQPEQKSELFLRFSHRKSDNGRSEYGAGLGLSVVKAIVDSHHGQVGVEDSPGGGAAFWFTIPILDQGSTGEGNTSQ